jgi:hypothetical protein
MSTLQAHRAAQHMHSVKALLIGFDNLSVFRVGENLFTPSPSLPLQFKWVIKTVFLTVCLTASG